MDLTTNYNYANTSYWVEISTHCPGLIASKTCDPLSTSQNGPLHHTFGCAVTLGSQVTTCDLTVRLDLVQVRPYTWSGLGDWGSCVWCMQFSDHHYSMAT